MEAPESAMKKIHWTKRAVSRRSRANARKKRLNSYCDNYRTLLNAHIADTLRSGTSDDKLSLQPSQVGATVWSGAEKDSFFRALARRGRHDLSAIALEICTKNEFEIHEYLQLLQGTLAKIHLFSRRLETLNIHDVPAAFEISEKCCVQMEKSGDALALLQQATETELEKKKYPESWLLTPKIARTIESRLREGEEGEREIYKATPSARVLDLKAFLHLSSTIFMNSQIPESNWRYYAESKEKPSILHTAFQDIHNLTISLTKKIISSSLFVAMSRIRATKSSTHKPRNFVRRQDVLAALKILNINRRVKPSWAQIAKRCGVHVREGDRGRRRKPNPGENSSVSSQDKPASETNAQPTADQASFSRGLVETGNEPSVGSSTSHSQSDDLTIASSPSQPRDGRSSSPGGSQSDDEGPSDSFLEAVDRNGSLAEERRLWDVLGKRPQRGCVTGDVPVPQPGPAVPRKSRDELDAWDSWVEKAAEWKAYEMSGVAPAFVRNRRMRDGDGDEDEDGGLLVGRPSKKVRRRESGRKVAEGVEGRMCE
ncbi:MAG: hypothetical protein LQ342_003908 [Letrouitia transgressa]|nr:MAG: hypothetical protein LQ342_003908 [Letrouitia transgressa]